MLICLVRSFTVVLKTKEGTKTIIPHSGTCVVLIPMYTITILLCIHVDGGGIGIDDLETLDFIDVTNFEDVQELRREEDAFSDPIYIPNGMLYGERTVTSAYVSDTKTIARKSMDEL